MCYCWKVQRSDGVVMGFTEHDVDIKFDNVQYQAESGFTATQIEQSLGLAVDNQNMAGALSSDYITEKDIAAGKYDSATVDLFWVNWQNPEQRIKVAGGKIGEVKRRLTNFEAEFRSNADKLNEKVGRVYQRTCDADLGDARCGFKFKDFMNRDASINLTDKYSEAWEALKLFDEPEFTNSDYPIQLLPYTVDGGLTGVDMQFQWPTGAQFPVSYIPGAGLRFSALPGSQQLGVLIFPYGTQGRYLTYPYYDISVDHYFRFPGDVVQQSSSFIGWSYKYYVGAPVSPYGGTYVSYVNNVFDARVTQVAGAENWYMIRDAQGNPVQTYYVGNGTQPAFSFTNLTTPASFSEAAVEALIEAYNTASGGGTTTTATVDITTAFTVTYSGPVPVAIEIGGRGGSLNTTTSTATFTGVLKAKRVFRYQDYDNVGTAPRGFAAVFDVKFTMANGSTATGEFAIGWLKSDPSTTYVSDTYSVNDNNSLAISGYDNPLVNIAWYDRANPGPAWMGTYVSSASGSPPNSQIPHGSLNIPANYPAMMQGKVFGFDLSQVRNHRIWLYATTDAQYFIGSPGWHANDFSGTVAAIQGNGQAASTSVVSLPQRSWTSGGWWQQSINPSRGPKMAELRVSPTGQWPDANRYSDTFQMIEEAMLDFNEAVRLAVDWYRNGQPISQATLNANMLTTANDSAQLYLDYDLDIAKRTHTIPLAVPRTIVDYNNWINANAIANGSATAQTLPFLLVPTRRDNLSAATATSIITFLGTQGIVSGTATKAFDIIIKDQWVKGNPMPYTASYTGPVRGKVLNLTNPLDYRARLFVVTDAAYLVGTVDLEADGSFYFSSSGTGSKVISIRLKADDSILTEAKPGIGLVRSYRIPKPVVHPTNVYAEVSVASQGLYNVDIAATVTAGGSGTTSYSLTYAQYQAEVANPAITGTAFSISLQFKRLSQVISGLFGYYKLRVWQGSTPTDYNISAAGQVTFTTTAWGPTTRMELYSRVAVEDDIVVYFALKDRCFTYDQGVALIAACIVADQSYAERWVEGLLKSLYIDNAEPVQVLGNRTTNPKLVGNVAFSVDRNTGAPPDDYIRNGATAWVGTALGYFCRTFPYSDFYPEALTRLTSLVNNLDTQYRIIPGHPDYRKDGQPSNPGNDPNLYPIIPPTNGITVAPTRANIPAERQDNRYGLYTGGYGAYVSAYQGYAPAYYIPWVAAEHNIDIYFLLTDMYKVTGDVKWKTRAAELFSNLVDVLWDENQGRLIQGCRSLSKDYWTALDQHSWGACMLIAGGEPEKARRAMAQWTPRFKWILAEGQEGYSPYREGIGLPAGQYSPFDDINSGGVNLFPDVGPDYPAASRGVWPEGTFGVVLAQLALGQKIQASKTYASVAPLLNQFGYIYTTQPDLGYELQAWESVAGTGWAIIGANPKGFWEVYEDLLSVTELITIDVVGPNSWVGEITAVSGRLIYCTGASTAQGQPAFYENDRFTSGLFKVKSGLLDGYAAEIKKHWVEGNTMVIELWKLPPKGPLLGERFAARAGCDKRGKTCLQKFDNFVNFQGFPFMPGNDTFGQYPNKNDPKMDGGSTNEGWDL